MTTDQLTASQKSVYPGDFFTSHGWGFGMSVVTRRTEPCAPVGTFGWSGGMGTYWDADPHENMTIILFTQRMWSSPVPPSVCTDFRTLAYAAIDD
jgi:CubicO group peptidase (beta-lactamase class C family)